MTTKDANTDSGLGITWLVAVVYAFVKWGFFHGILNIFIPYAIVWDIVQFLIENL